MGSDYVLARNLLPAWLPLTIAVAAGVASLSRRLLVAGVLTTALAAIAVNVLLAFSPQHQRDDWRGVAAALGRPRAGRVIVVAPSWQYVALATYRSRLAFMPPTATVNEIDTVTYDGFVPGFPPYYSPTRTIIPGPPFRRVQTTIFQRFTVGRYLAPEPTRQLRQSLTDLSTNGAVPFVEPGSSRGQP